MQKLVSILAVLSILSLNGCKKDQIISPADKSLIKSDKGLLCRGCGSWDLNDPSLSIESTTTDNDNGTTTEFVDGKRIRVETPAKPLIPAEKAGDPVIPVIPVNPKEN